MTARGRSFGTIERSVQKAITGMHRLAYDVSGGRVGATVVGNPVGVLTTTGRKSGARRSTPLFVYEEGDDFIVVGSNGGTATTPAWVLNLQADPMATVRVRGVEHPVRAEVMTAEEKAAWWPILTERYSGYASYQAKTDREIPVLWLRRTARV